MQHQSSSSVFLNYFILSSVLAEEDNLASPHSEGNTRKTAVYWWEYSESPSVWELVSGKRARGRYHLCFKDVCKRGIRPMYRAVGRCRQRSLTPETQFKPRFGETRGETEVCRRGEGKKSTQWHLGRASSHALVLIVSATPVWACIAITITPLPSAAEA